MSLEIKNIKVTAEEKTILHDITLTVKPGELHVIMGPNGAGKSTLANTIAGHPKYTVEAGHIVIDGEEFADQSPEARAKAGLFLSMQQTPAIAGVTISNFLRIAHDALRGEKSHPVKFHRALVEKAEGFGIDKAFLKRHVGVGLSGGEKKRMEMLQLAVLQPRYAILDETDSGLDVDALKIVTESIKQYRNDERGLLLITHYDKFLKDLSPDVVHVLIDGRIVASGGQEIADEIAKNGYARYSA